MTDQARDAHRRRGQAHTWIGKGKVQAAMSGDELSLRVDALTTQSRRFKTLIGEFFRLEFKRARPKYGPYEVVIVIERTERSPVHDVDNVAKAVLDALTGVVFHDDSQVEKLLVTKQIGERARVSVTARPLVRPEQDLLEEA
ncbi:RusA family crossover junction endodeoxyribonuclease [Maricaulis sp. D1M11]|uniref:RusA family crossover junction endodeoxyribonuclease n=1 Tax=Maricaulis sp. D1M11 TaxID=3076117 RepID=UPI0039B45D37